MMPLRVRVSVYVALTHLGCSLCLSISVCLSISLSVCMSVYQDELAEVLVTLFEFKNKLAPFLGRILNTEVSSTHTYNTQCTLDSLYPWDQSQCPV